LLAQPQTLEDPKRLQALNHERHHIESVVLRVENLSREIQSALELFELSKAESEFTLMDEIERLIRPLEQELSVFEVNTLLSGEDDRRNAILTVQAGSGGTDAMDFAQMLLRMYVRYAEGSAFETKLLDLQEGEEAGIKSATLLITGENVYGYLKTERGVHRLVRISPFDANKRRHTSFAAVLVYPEIEDDITVEIDEKDLKIDTFRASGKGGQHINKTDSAVRITHIPTGIVVQCQNERSQFKNKAMAMKILRSRIYDLLQEEQEAKFSSYNQDRKEATFGSQIRSYILQPYQMVKDHRTGLETSNIQATLDGQILPFIEKALYAKVGGRG
jgi:peptide chain release factor 2